MVAMAINKSSKFLRNVVARDISRLYPAKSAKLTLVKKYAGYTTVRFFDARC